MISASGRLAQGNSVTRITDHPNMNLTVEYVHKTLAQTIKTQFWLVFSACLLNSMSLLISTVLVWFDVA